MAKALQGVREWSVGGGDLGWAWSPIKKDLPLPDGGFNFNKCSVGF